MLTYALFGNPNTGKTSLFNQLTGSYQTVGNWAGVTVEKKIGKLKGNQGELIDLPGIYTLNPLSEDETVAMNFLLQESFEGAVNIVDASHLDKNLYLTVQLLEFGKPLVIGLNMVDVAKRRGIDVDAQKLEEVLGIPVVPIIARSGQGLDQLQTYLAQLSDKSRRALRLNYGDAVEQAIENIEANIPDDSHNRRWLALQFLEGNPIVEKYLSENISMDALNRFKQQAEKLLNGRSLYQHIQTVRQEFVQDVMKKTVRKGKANVLLSERLDQVLTHRIFGIPIFLGLMFLIFQLTFDWLGTPLSDALDSFFAGPLTGWLEALLGAMDATVFIHRLIIDGIVAGVGGVLVFVPQIFILFFFISIIEDSGYMARVAVLMDRVMEKIGLNGKAFIPMIIGFGCNVPAVMATRSIEQPKERLITMLLSPLMSCSARLPVYALFAGAFFAENQGIVVLSLYVLGIILAFALAKLLSSTILRNEGSFFVVELPPYHTPQVRSLIRSTWEKGKGFIKKAGTIIFAGTVLIWLLSYTGPTGMDVSIDESFLAVSGQWVAPLLAPIGFGTWEAGVALMTGALAKEVIISTMNIIYFVPDVDTLKGVIMASFTPLQAYSFMAFVLLYMPCIATVAVIRKESHSLKWTLFSLVYGLVLAYLVSLVIYQVGQLLGF
ncbi:ferrous iron transport protein B [Melghiribacillus thermohalophilus]|uniref:Ferrous iron transport protein B n=1 Tax=Melghiribacillus thermohalophilus TaxID=1324956 RepID=A0A4R3MWE4_9BACI|nr:ferrous iron transport protein B [Melghiribacillus thermohalophilus]TCT20900.1 ferrous iron transport protein B [Melghiribacillus thermohalophilus]